MRGSLSQSLSFSPRWLRVEVGGCPVGFSADLHILTESSTENTMRYGMITTGVLVLLYIHYTVRFLCFNFICDTSSVNTSFLAYLSRDAFEWM